jgi:hypothetical protein
MEVKTVGWHYFIYKYTNIVYIQIKYFNEMAKSLLTQ